MPFFLKINVALRKQNCHEIGSERIDLINDIDTCIIGRLSANNYTHRQKPSNTTFFFGDTALEVAGRNMWVMEIRYFEFY